MSDHGAVDGSTAWVRSAVAVGGTFAVLAALYWKTSAASARADAHPRTGADRNDDRGRATPAHTGDPANGRSSSGGRGGAASRAATPSERDASALRSVTPVMSFRVSSTAGGHRGETPTNSIRGRTSADRSTAASPAPPTRNVHFGTAEGATTDSAATWSSEDSHSSDRFFAAGLPSQLEWSDPVLGIFLQYPTHNMLQSALVRAAPCIRLSFKLRALTTDGNVGDLGAREMTIRIEQTGPLPNDRGGLGDPALSGVSRVAGIRGFAPGASSGSPARSLPPREFSTVDFQRSMSPRKTTTASNSASRFASSFDDAGGVSGDDSDVAARTVEEHIDAYRGYLNEFTDVAVVPPPGYAKNVHAETDTVEVRIRSAPQRQTAVLDDVVPVDHADYHLLVYRSTTGADPSEAGKRAAAYPSKAPKTPSYGAVFIAAHPCIPHLFVTVTIPHLKHHPITAKGRPHASLCDILSYIVFAAPLSTPSYNLLAEPKCGTAFRVPLCFGRHSSRALLREAASGGPETGPYAELHSDSDEDQELNFADIWDRAERQRKRAHRSGLRSQMSAASTAATGRIAPMAASQFRTAPSTAAGSEMSSSAAPHTRPRLDAHHHRQSRRSSQQQLPARESAARGHAHASLKGRVATRYAMLCADDCAVIASLEPFAAGGEKALPLVTRECVQRLSHSLQLVPRLRCVVDGEDSPSPPQAAPGRGAAKQMVLRARVRQLAVTRLGDSAWWPAALWSFLRPYDITGENINARNNQPDMLPLSPPNTRGRNPTQRVTINCAGTMDHLRAVRDDGLGNTATNNNTMSPTESFVSRPPAADANSQTLSRMDCVDDRGATKRGEACRFALYCMAVPMSANPSAASFCSLAVLASRSVSRTPFAGFYDKCLSTMSLDNFRGQTPTLHYVGNRHNIRLALPKHWHALEPALADPALVLYRAELPPGRVNPPFLTQSQPTAGSDDPSSPRLPSAGAMPLPPAEADRHRQQDNNSDWDFAGPQAVPGSGSASPLGGQSCGGLGGDGLLLREISAHPLHPRPPQQEGGDGAAFGGVGDGVGEAGDEAAATAEQQHHPKKSSSGDWWRNLLPVITLQTTAAPSKNELLERFPPHDVTARFRAKSLPIPPPPTSAPAYAGDPSSPSYFDLWCRWIAAMAAEASSTTTNFDPTQSPMGSAPDEDVSVRTESIKCGGMRGVLLTVELSVVIETSTPAAMSCTMAPTTPQSGPSAAGGLPSGPLAGTQSSASITATAAGSPPGHHPRAPPPPPPSFGAASVPRQDTAGGLSSVSSALFHSCEGPPMALPPQGPAAAAAAAGLSAPDRSPLAHPSLSPPLAAPPGEVVRHLRFSSFAAAPGSSLNACSSPSLMTLADHVRHLDVALLAHLQAWRWAATEGAAATPGGGGGGGGGGVSSGGGPVDASGGTAPGQSNRSAATSAPPTPIHRPMRITATGHGGPLPLGPQRRMAREVRVIVALLPPLWHQQARQPSEPSVGGGQTPHAADDVAGDAEANADLDRTSQIWQTQALPAELAAPAREALVSMLRTLELTPK